MSTKPPTPEYIFRGHNGEVNSLTLAGNDQYLLTSDQNGIVIIWDLKDKRSLYKWQAHTSAILSISFIGDLVISQGREGILKIWDFRSLLQGESQPILELPVESLHFCKFSAISHLSKMMIAYAKDRDTVVIGEVLSGLTLHTLKYEEAGVGACMSLRLFETKGQLMLLCGYESGKTSLWVIDEDKPRMVWSAKNHNEPVLAIDVNQEATVGISAGADSNLVLFDLNQDKHRVIRSTLIKHHGVSEVRFRSDGRIIATAGWDSKIRVFSTKTLKPLAILNFHRGSIYTVGFTRPENYLVAGSKDGRVSWWQIY
ncbi:WD40 repeat-like protein [Basidiobolus meristosporus CBS 931.73]|uniref:ASTRA-associated protein 1 n=1 Tax=Basidiobolus meristosporus CBS 931.73 TaxID=1314790 RepID=A0A1Y1ZBP4_9FUNG|nr:WD40 repeat-like protein [Basidiobolus meristosporus CBS 931.73]|eukprot:ORY07733.1 WD40 repeat-like protein [Basidiobolus meristosporus CBS 931.73]